MDINEYVVEGNTVLEKTVVEKAVYPFLGPDKSLDDVKQAREALEAAYKDRGYQAVQVEVPPQSGADGVVLFHVVEGTVGRLRVVGSEYSLPSEIKKEAPSLQPGTVLNFNKVQDDLVALNQWPGRRVTPALKAGATPGTVDVDLSVADKAPWSATVEFNNRQSVDTSPMRTSTTLSYANLWQLGHSISLSWETAPEDVGGTSVWSASYLAPIPDSPLSVLINGYKSNSNVASLGNINSLGKGTSLGGRLFIKLPGEEGYYHNAFIGADMKIFDDTTMIAGEKTYRPIRYYPFTVGYIGTLIEENSTTQGEISAVFASPDLGSAPSAFDDKRSGARGQQAYLKGRVSETLGLPYQAELAASFEGQLTDQPLITNEQFSAGGQDSVRGYYESEATGDYGYRAGVELRSPSVTDWVNPGGVFDQLRLVTFFDTARLWVLNPQEEETRIFGLSSTGIGLRLKTMEYFNGSLDFAVPLTPTDNTKRKAERILFRAWTEY